MKVYVAMIADRHTDVEPHVFSTADAAITFARREAQERATRPQDFHEEHVNGWLYCAYSTVEDDYVYVVERTVDAKKRAAHPTEG